MAKQKRKRGRPIGGKHPAVMRDYWRTMQQMNRAAHRFQQGTMIGKFNVKQKGKKKK